LVYIVVYLLLLETNKFLLKTFDCQSIESISKTMTIDSRNILYFYFYFYLW